MEYKYIHNYLKQWNPIVNCEKPYGCIVAVNHFDKFVTIGVSICNPRDTYNKKIGFDLAYKRAVEYPIEYKLCSFHRFAILEAVDRIIVRSVRYFKNIPVIYPKNFKIVRWDED